MTKRVNASRAFYTFWLAPLALSVVGCATSDASRSAITAPAPGARPAATGYDWAQVLARPPAAGGDLDRLDMQAVRAYQGQQGSPRWLQAAADNSLDLAQAYSSVLGPDFTQAKQPEAMAVLAYAGRMLSIASRESKSTFPRPRPFLADPNIKICINDPPAGSSYPSGHAGWGWLSGQVLARIEPDKASALLVRGRDYGHSRVVCGVHYPTDIEAGRYLADAVLARLDNDPEYQRLLVAAKVAAVER